MVDRITLRLDPRSTLGKQVKSLRRAGVVPVHLYGPGIESRSLQCQVRELTGAIARAGRNIPISITVEGQSGKHLAFVREIQWDSVKGDLLHVDFLRAEETQRVSAEVPVVLVGESPAARETSRTVVQQRRVLTVEALPLDMPQDLTVDLSSLTQPDGIIRAGDVYLPADATLLTDADEVVVRLEAPRVEEVVEEEAPVTAEEQAEAAEGGQKAPDEG